MPSELVNKLFKRRSDVEAGGQSWESKPEQSSADATHLADLKFDAPPAQVWLQQLDITPEEDALAEAIADGLAERREALPQHLRPAVTEEEAARLEELAQQLVALKKALESERDGLGEARGELERREADIRARECKLEAERKLKQEREEARRSYPQPAWLDNIEGVMNVGVVGNAGVGKSLLINKLRRIRPQGHGWAPVGVCETTREPTKYPFPGQPQVCLWDLPGSGTAAIPSETYVQDMGLRYFDKVLICTAGRFTETEIKLRKELESHSVPFFMVRTKVDIDIVNNREDNLKEGNVTLEEIREDLRRNHSSPHVYLVSSRDPEQFDMPQVVKDLFPGTTRAMDPYAQAFVPTAPSWNQAWAMPVVFSAVVTGLQGRWLDDYGAVYLINGLQTHVSLEQGTKAALVPLVESQGCVVWVGRWFVNEDAVNLARRCGELQWIPSSPTDVPLRWKWAD